MQLRGYLLNYLHNYVAILFVVLYVITAIITTVLSNGITTNNPPVLGIVAMILVSVLLPIIYSLFSLYKYKRKKTVDNLLNIFKSLAAFFIFIFLVYVVISAIIALTSIISGTPIATYNSIIFIFAYSLTTILVSILFLPLLIAPYYIPRTAIAILLGGILSSYIIFNNLAQIKNTLDFLLIILGIFITALPSILSFLQKSSQYGVDPKRIIPQLFAAEFFLIISFVILFIAYLVIANSGNISSGFGPLAIYVALSFGLTFLIGGLIISLESLYLIFSKMQSFLFS